jgi:hypothetical protein
MPWPGSRAWPAAMLQAHGAHLPHRSQALFFVHRKQE